MAGRRSRSQWIDVNVSKIREYVELLVGSAMMPYYAKNLLDLRSFRVRKPPVPDGAPVPEARSDKEYAEAAVYSVVLISMVAVLHNRNGNIITDGKYRFEEARKLLIENNMIDDYLVKAVDLKRGYQTGSKSFKAAIESMSLFNSDIKSVLLNFTAIQSSFPSNGSGAFPLQLFFPLQLSPEDVKVVNEESPPGVLVDEPAQTTAAADLPDPQLAEEPVLMDVTQDGTNNSNSTEAMEVDEESPSSPAQTGEHQDVAEPQIAEEPEPMDITQDVQEIAVVSDPMADEVSEVEAVKHEAASNVIHIPSPARSAVYVVEEMDWIQTEIAKTYTDYILFRDAAEQDLLTNIISQRGDEVNPCPFAEWQTEEALIDALYDKLDDMVRAGLLQETTGTAVDGNTRWYKRLVSSDSLKPK